MYIAGLLLGVQTDIGPALRFDWVARSLPVTTRVGSWVWLLSA